MDPLGGIMKNYSLTPWKAGNIMQNTSNTIVTFLARWEKDITTLILIIVPIMTSINRTTTSNVSRMLYQVNTFP